jgi:hypothetical protein
LDCPYFLEYIYNTAGMNKLKKSVGSNLNTSVIQGEPDIAKLRDFDKFWIDANDVEQVQTKNRLLKQQ